MGEENAGSLAPPWLNPVVVRAEPRGGLRITTCQPLDRLRVMLRLHHSIEPLVLHASLLCERVWTIAGNMIGVPDRDATSARSKRNGGCHAGADVAISYVGPVFGSWEAPW